MDTAQREGRRRIAMHTIPLNLLAPHKPSMACLPRGPRLHSSSTASLAVPVLEVNLEAPREPLRCKARANLVRQLTQHLVLVLLLEHLVSARASVQPQCL